jgi:hypothetical protein
MVGFCQGSRHRAWARRCDLGPRKGSALNRAQYPSDIIALVMLWRLPDRPGMFALRGLTFSHELSGSGKRTPALADSLRHRCRGRIGRRGYVEETYYLKAAGRWRYVDRRRYRCACGCTVQRASRHEGGAGVPRLSAGGHRRHARAGHDRRSRPLPAGDPDRVGHARAPPHQPLPEPRAGNRTTAASKADTARRRNGNLPNVEGRPVTNVRNT